MWWIRTASFEEFVRWYLVRERRKRMAESDLTGRSLNSLVTEMQRLHPDKLRPWFERARWSIVSLDAVNDAMHLVCLDNWEVRRNRLVSGAGSDNRIARAVVARARDIHYFDNERVRRSNSVEAHFRQERIEAFRRNWPVLKEDERLTICDLNSEERAENPSGTYYLHDGFGRLLAYLYAIVYEGRQYGPIEAFLAEQT
jgi:hypothetical protein